MKGTVGKRRQAMKIKAGITLVAMMAAAIAPAFAQDSGADIYKAKCQSCHGAEGTPNPGIAKMMGVKPVSDPSVKSLSEAQMITDTTNGKGKMPAFKGKLTDAQIKASVDYFRSLAK
jgi:cytochrome c6